MPNVRAAPQQTNKTDYKTKNSMIKTYWELRLGYKEFDDWNSFGTIGWNYGQRVVVG